MGNIDEISRSIGRLESKVDHLISAHEDFADKFNAHDERLKTMESYKNYAMGVVAAVTLLCTVVFDFVKSRILGGA